LLHFFRVFGQQLRAVEIEFPRQIEMNPGYLL
jgi:hypothetical protein